MYNKPLSVSTDTPKAKPTKVMRGAPVTGGPINFASFMPQGSMPPGGMGLKNGAMGASPEQAMQGMGLNTKAMATLARMMQDNGGKAQSSSSGNAAEAQRSGLPLGKQDLFRLKARPETEATAGSRNRTRSTKRGQSVAQGVLSAIDRLRQKISGPVDSDSVGKLAAQFESGRDGVAAVGYDRHGGTSYGKYQIASRVGTMNSFISFLKTEAPDIATRLEQAGPANTKSKRGRMPDEWRAIADEQPERFERLQDRFIHASHFQPAVKALAERTGMKMDAMPDALQEVVFSTAVQHGPAGAARIVSRAISQIGESRLDPENNSPASLAKAQENLIRKIYDGRSNQFKSSTKSVQTAVKSRLRQEMGMAIGMFRQERSAHA